MQPDLPTRPWEKLGSDIFQFNGASYLIIVDYREIKHDVYGKRQDEISFSPKHRETWFN